jgi:hypothetical protein
MANLTYFLSERRVLENILGRISTGLSRSVGSVLDFLPTMNENLLQYHYLLNVSPEILGFQNELVSFS